MMHKFELHGRSFREFSVGRVTAPLVDRTTTFHHFDVKVEPISKAPAPNEFKLTLSDYLGVTWVR